MHSSDTANERRAYIERATEFDRETFEQLDLRRLSLANKTFTQCTFTAVQLHESSWQSALLEDCTFRDCDLSGATMKGTRLRDVSFHSTRLMGVDWSHLGDFAAMSFDACDLRYAMFVGLSLRKLRCRSCRASEATFEDCDLTQADFSGSDLRATKIERCDLTRADFSTASGALINPAINRGKGAKIGAESAALLATHLGLVVVGFDAGTDEGAPRPPAPRKRAR
jgi:fluoroquinolone resistance protein